MDVSQSFQIYKKLCSMSLVLAVQSPYRAIIVTICIDEMTGVGEKARRMFTPLRSVKPRATRGAFLRITFLKLVPFQLYTHLAVMGLRVARRVPYSKATLSTRPWNSRRSPSAHMSFGRSTGNSIRLNPSQHK